MEERGERECVLKMNVAALRSFALVPLPRPRQTDARSSSCRSPWWWGSLRWEGGREGGARGVRGWRGEREDGCPRFSSLRVARAAGVRATHTRACCVWRGARGGGPALSRRGGACACVCVTLRGSEVGECQTESREEKTRERPFLPCASHLGSAPRRPHHSPTTLVSCLPSPPSPPRPAPRGPPPARARPSSSARTRRGRAPSKTGATRAPG